MYVTIFFNLSPSSSHLHPPQVDNCDSNSRLVVDEDDNVNSDSGLKGLTLRLLIMAIFVFTPFYYQIKAQLLEAK